MCGRFAIGQEPWSEFHDRLNLVQPAMNLEPSWNIKPTQPAPVVTRDDGQNRVHVMKWGFQFEVRGKKVPGFNARAEKADTTWPYRYSVGKRHCLVPAIGFYEWTGEKGNRQPHFIHLKSVRLFFMAGLWDRREIDGEETDCFTILTTAANDFMKPLHNRMPIILSEESWPDWLAGDVAPDSLTPVPADDMAEHVVAPLRGDGPDLIKPVKSSTDEDTPPAQDTLF